LLCLWQSAHFRDGFLKCFDHKPILERWPLVKPGL
jgi:hypothetical protein